MSKGKVTSDEVAGMVCLGFVYVCIGIIVAITLTVTGLVDPNVTPAEVVALIVLWPLFAMKYIVLGVWAVLCAGYYLLV